MFATCKVQQRVLQQEHPSSDCHLLRNDELVLIFRSVIPLVVITGQPQHLLERHAETLSCAMNVAQVAQQSASQADH